MKKSKINSVLNVIIAVLVIVVIVIGSTFFIRTSQQSKPGKNETVSKVKKSSSSKNTRLNEHQLSGQSKARMRVTKL